MRILITEEALQTGTGHWPSYIGGNAAGLRGAGDEVDVLIHREAADAVVELVGGTRWFSRNCWTDPASQGALGGMHHNFRFFGEIREWMQTHDAYDWVCALTMRLQHLLAFALLSRSGAIPSSTRFLLLFVQGFARYDGSENSPVFPNNLSTKLARFCFRLMRPAVESGRIILAAETSGMRDELQRFTGLPVSLFPHPVPAPPPISNSQDLGAKGKEQGVLTITCPGFARHEKGNDLLQDAILTILDGPDGDRFRFIMQWPEPFALPDGSLLGPDPRLVNNTQVVFLNQSLDVDGYAELLKQSDLVILPYRRRSYHHRVSRVAIEAAGRGIPLIYMSDTWTSEIADLAGCGIEIQDESAESIIEAVKKAVLHHIEHRNAAMKGGSRVTSFHSVHQFRRQLQASHWL